MNYNKIIFLDIDGILHDRFSYSYKYPRWIVSLLMRKNDINKITPVDFYNLHCKFPKNPGRMLLKFAQKFQVGIVISSSWVKYYKDDEALKEVLKAYYAPLANFYVGSVSSTFSKADAIKMWLSDNNYQGAYVVLDDDFLDIENQVLVENILVRKNIEQMMNYLEIQ